MIGRPTAVFFMFRLLERHGSQACRSLVVTRYHCSRGNCYFSSLIQISALIASCVRNRSISESLKKACLAVKCHDEDWITFFWNSNYGLISHALEETRANRQRKRCRLAMRVITHIMPPHVPDSTHNALKCIWRRAQTMSGRFACMVWMRRAHLKPNNTTQPRSSLQRVACARMGACFSDESRPLTSPAAPKTHSRGGYVRLVLLCGASHASTTTRTARNAAQRGTGRGLGQDGDDG